MKMLLLALTATTLAAAPLGAQAPAAVAPVAPAAGACELHVFPAERFQPVVIA